MTRAMIDDRSCSARYLSNRFHSNMTSRTRAPWSAVIAQKTSSREDSFLIGRDAMQRPVGRGQAAIGTDANHLTRLCETISRSYPSSLRISVFSTSLAGQPVSCSGDATRWHIPTRLNFQTFVGSHINHDAGLRLEEFVRFTRLRMAWVVIRYRRYRLSL